MPRYDSGVAPAVRELNRIPGVRTRASCQGKSSPEERTTHADLAYVAFHGPLPIAFEEQLLRTIGDVARVEPDSIYSRWPERNGELCARLAGVTREFRAERSARRWREWKVPLGEAIEAVTTALASGRANALVWCFACGRLGSVASHSGCRPVALLDEDPERPLATFARFLAEDPSPPDPRLREREGDRKVRERVERGDFGESYRESWHRFLTRCAGEALRTEVRGQMMAQRRAGDAVDYYFEPSRVVFARREG